jgi:hypothetical protein
MWHNSLIIRNLVRLGLSKKNVVKPARFSYFHCHSHRTVPRQTVFALKRIGANTETVTTKNNIGGTR